MSGGAAAVGIVVAASAAMRGNWTAPRRWTATLVFAGLIVAGYAAQRVWPVVLPALSRDAHAIRDGEWYRLLTTHFVHSGGLPHVTGNLVLLALVGPVATARLGTARWLTALLAGAMAEEWAALSLDPVGGGASFAILGLAGGLLIRRPLHPVPAVVGLSAACALLLLGDPHGASLLAGAAITAIAVRGPASK